ncbi:DUF480 domain-containing protein [Noviherbaspirillum sp. 1P10PC]|uniref:YceH family protein n=1 Tax=Noviherbaspirillum sp. 1P10PC TaxID=3132292 RepID=UPI0039A2ABB9
MSDDLPLDAVEVRVLAVLAEKEQLTPDNYPMSLNALVGGCNQLSSRDPVMTLAEEEVRDALDRLMAKKLAAEVSQAGARVAKYEHRMRLRWTLEQDRLAALVMLMLRGPQTAAEVRSRAGRMHEFGNVAAVEEALQFLIDKYPPLAVKLARAPGAKEARHAHLLSGEPAEGMEQAAGQAVAAPRQDRVSQLEAEVAQLREELARLSAEFAEFRRLLE